VPAAFDPEQHKALEHHLRRLAGAAEWLEREVRDERECHAALAQAAVIEHALRDVVTTLVDGHLRHCVVGAIERGQSPDEVARLLGSTRSILFAVSR